MGQDDRRGQQRSGGQGQGAQRGQRQQRGNGGNNRPWQVLYPRDYKDREGKDQTEYLRIGVAWPLPRGGYSVEALGVRVLIKPPADPREPDESGGNG